MSQSLKHSKDYHNLLDNVIDNERLSEGKVSNEVLWVQMGSQLEIEGVDKTQISTIVRKDIEDMMYEKEFKNIIPREEYRYTKTKYFEVMKDNGWTNPLMARNVKSDPSADQDNSSINTPNNSMIELCYDIIDVVRILIEKSKSKDINLEDTFGKKIMNEFYKQQKTLIFNIQNAIDHKTKIPKNTEIFLLDLLATTTASINKIGEKFMEENLIRLKEQRTISIRTGKPVPFITLKQATKFKNGEKVSKQILLRPKSRDTSIYLEYDGIQCDCDSWRVRSGICFDCDKKHTLNHLSKCSYCQVPLYKERLEYIAKHGKCKDCRMDVDLPEELLVLVRC